MFKHKPTPNYWFKDIFVVIGVVLVWRGIWYVLDWMDKWMFGDSHFITAFAGVLIGLLILYYI